MQPTCLTDGPNRLTSLGDTLERTSFQRKLGLTLGLHLGQVIDVLSCTGAAKLIHKNQTTNDVAW